MTLDLVEQVYSLLLSESLPYGLDFKNQIYNCCNTSNLQEQVIELNHFWRLQLGSLKVNTFHVRKFLDDSLPGHIWLNEFKEHVLPYITTHMRTNLYEWRLTTPCRVYVTGERYNVKLENKHAPIIDTELLKQLKHISEDLTQITVIDDGISNISKILRRFCEIHNVKYIKYCVDESYFDKFSTLIQRTDSIMGVATHIVNIYTKDKNKYLYEYVNNSEKNMYRNDNDVDNPTLDIMISYINIS